MSGPRCPIITIDGPSGSGKGTIARRVADQPGLASARQRGVVPVGRPCCTPDPASIRADEAAHAACAMGLDVRFGANHRGDEQIWLAGTDVTAAIRTERAGEEASRVAAMPPVRTALLDRQRAFAETPGLVADGRDMGTVVFPHAELKIFLTASADERARRRHKQLKDKGLDVSLAALSREIAERDQRDMRRAVAPLVAASDAQIVDSTSLTIDAVVDRVLAAADERCV